MKLQSVVGLGFIWKMVVGCAVVVLLTTTACDAEDVTLDLYGPETMSSDQVALYVAELWGGAPVLGFVYWIPFVDLDDDNWPDTNERLSDQVLYSEVDRLGKADIEFWVDPESYFAERDLDIPDEMTVGIWAELYWSDPIEPRVTLRDEVETTITAPSE